MASLSSAAVTEGEILVVVSKLKKYISDRSGMNTAQSVMSVLSDRLRKLCDQAIQEAQREGRKTVMDRDFK
jgi:histone H3/H4